MAAKRLQMTRNRLFARILTSAPPIKHVNKTTLYGMAGEGNPVNSGETVAIKTHALSDMTKKLGTIPEKCIILIRNPADSFISIANMRLTHSHTGKVDFSEYFKNMKNMNHPNLTRLKKFLQDMPNEFIDTWSYLGTTTCKKNVTVFYEDLKKDTEYEMARILDFLGFSDERLVCLEGNSVGSFKRNQPSSNRKWLSNLWNEREKENFTRLLEDLPLQLPENYSFFLKN